MAGPRLTPQTFESALQRTKFPNPEHPNRPGKVGFQLNAHGMTTDGAEFWWSNSAAGPYNGAPPGSICYVDGGRRHALGAWPSDGDPFYSGPCDTGTAKVPVTSVPI